MTFEQRYTQKIVVRQRKRDENENTSGDENENTSETAFVRKLSSGCHTLSRYVFSLRSPLPKARAFSLEALDEIKTTCTRS